MLVMGLGDMRVKLALTPESVEDLSWWVCSLAHLGGKSILEQSLALFHLLRLLTFGLGEGTVCGGHCGWNMDGKGYQ